MPLYVEWWPEHLVNDPITMQCNQAWAEKCYEILKDGGIMVTDHGAYVKRDGGLYRLGSPREEEGSCH